MYLINNILTAQNILEDNYSVHERILSLDEKTELTRLLSEVDFADCASYFRGVGFHLLNEIYRTDDFELICQYIFNIGAKAAHFHTNEIENNFNNIRELLVEMIQKEYIKYLDIKDLDIDEWMRRVNTYTGDNPYLTKLVYLYYFQFFHLEGNTLKNKAVSMLISTTLEYDVAMHFASNSSDRGGIILHIIKPNYKLYHSTNENIKLTESLKRHNIPTIIYFDPFPTEYEINFMMGIYPQCIFAIENTSTKEISINPSLLECINSNEKRQFLVSNKAIPVDRDGSVNLNNSYK